MDYAGDVSPKQAWGELQKDARAQLIDVRTQPEWAFVGAPDLSSLQKQTVFQSWQSFPTMAIDSGFVDKIAAKFPDPATPLYFICRTGGRSRAAAQAMAAAGYRQCYNVSDGFEGVPDGQRHRGTATGWKAEGLPWVQD